MNSCYRTWFSSWSSTLHGEYSIILFLLSRINDLFPPLDCVILSNSCTILLCFIRFLTLFLFLPMRIRQLTASAGLQILFLTSWALSASYSPCSFVIKFHATIGHQPSINQSINQSINRPYNFVTSICSTFMLYGSLSPQHSRYSNYGWRRRPPHKQSSYEYTEKTVATVDKGWCSSLAVERGTNNFSPLKQPLMKW